MDSDRVKIVKQAAGQRNHEESSQTTKENDPDKIVKQAAGKKKKKKAVKSTDDNDPDEIVKQAAGQEADKSTEDNDPDKVVEQAAGQKKQKKAVESKDSDRVKLVKQAAGQMAPAKSIAEVFLDDRFPKWKEDNKTYMIPPIFEAEHSRHQIGTAQSVPYTDSGDDGESIIYELLRRLGDEEKMGMFVVYSFNLQHIKNWKDVCKSYVVPELPKNDGEFDFIIFHHRLGLIFIEVKNISKEDERKEDNDAQSIKKKNAKKKKSKRKKKAKDQLQKSCAIMEIFSESTTIPCKKVVALPSTKKVGFNSQNFSDDTLLLGDDCQDLSSFKKWWNEAIERDFKETLAETPAETQDAYKQVLSTVLMIRHWRPVTESEGIEEIHKSLVTFEFHGTEKSKPFPQLMEDEFPYLWNWCRDVLDRKIEKDPALRKEEKKLQEEKKSQECFAKKNTLNGDHLQKEEGMKFLNELLNKRKYIEGDKYSPIDDAISAVYEDHYCLFYKNILRFANKMREMVPDIKEEVVLDMHEHQVFPQIEHGEVLPESKGQEVLPDHGSEIKDQQLPEFNEREVLAKLHEMFPFTKLESPRDFNLLDRQLEKSLFTQQEKPSILDKQLYKELIRKMKFVRPREPHPSILLTLEQLAVFEGPEKQLIIGPPGSGKTELLKFKALKQNTEMNSGTDGKKTMYILANGSPDYPEKNSLFFHDIKEFFKDAPLVEVISVVLAEESAKDTEQTPSEIRRKILSGEYEHAFIDEYWIGSKPEEHEIILELVRGLPGYVWISSVFDYDQEMIKNNERMIERTQPLLTALDEKKGKVQRITQVMRGTNSIIELERDYSRLYGERSYPYGTEEILGHSYVGLPVTWVVVNEGSVDRMYEQCADIVKRAISDGFPEGVAQRGILTIKPKDIVVVDFAIRTEESRQIKESLPARLNNNRIPVWIFGENHALLDRSNNNSIPAWTFGKNHAQPVRLNNNDIPVLVPGENHADTMGKVALVQPHKRSASEFLDGVERKMVVVILPSGMVLKTATLANGASQLRNYDTYISFFRTMVKLVVISDKWENKETFLADVSKNI